MRENSKSFQNQQKQKLRGLQKKEKTWNPGEKYRIEKKATNYIIQLPQNYHIENI